jgi:hypothetical protein
MAGMGPGRPGKQVRSPVAQQRRNDVIVKTASTLLCHRLGNLPLPGVLQRPDNGQRNGNGPRVIEVEIQNETHQSVFRLKTIVVPRIGEGLRLQEPDGRWVSYDVLDVWYQKAEFGDVWVPYLHVRMSEGEISAIETERRNPMVDRSQAVPIEEFLKKFEGAEEHRTTPIRLDMSEGVGA